MRLIVALRRDLAAGLAEAAQIVQPRRAACAPPAQQLAVDELHVRLRAQRLGLGDMGWTETVGLGAQQHAVDAAEPGFVSRQRGVAAGAMLAAEPVGPGVPAGFGQERRDVGVAGHGHPGLAPDQVEHVLARPGLLAAARQRGAELGRQRRGTLVHARLAGKGRAQLLEESEVVFGPARVGHDDFGDELPQRLGGF